MRTTSPAGRAFIENEEKFSAVVYSDRGHPAIGFGHDLRPGEAFPNGVTRDDADEIMSNDLRVAESGVNSLVLVPLTQGQFDALVDCSYECGSACLHGTRCLAALNVGDYTSARAELLGFDHVQGVVDPEIAARRLRAAEQLWDAPDGVA